jgi:cyclopropane fatty-acyl-phospholipid synthase-like methyltransferase
MPSVQQNLETWENSYSWRQQGEEWSQAWGGSKSQWFGCIFPRIHKFLPVENILEIAPGYGRWTHYLKDYCRSLVGIDLSEKCVSFCKDRFDTHPNMEFFTNDGYSLEALSDNSCDFIFSFDSLVHAEIDVIESYIFQVAKKLTSSGVAFFHHSNLAALPELAEKRNIHWRASSVSAGLVKELIDKAELKCLSQEVINWRGNDLIDCLTLFTMPNSIFEQPFKLLENYEFMQEAEILRIRVTEET